MTSRTDHLENERRLAGMFGMGKICEVNDQYQARVQVTPELKTGWFRMGMMRNFGQTATWPYEVGEEVAYISQSGDLAQGVIICALANSENAANFQDKTFRANSEGGFEFTGDVTITGHVEIKGDVHSSKDIVAGSISLQNHTHSGVTAGPSVTGKPQ